MFQTPQMVQVSSNPSSQVPAMNFPYQAGKQFPYGVQQSPPMVFAAASSPIVHPISQNYATPPIPILSSSNSVSSVASNANSEANEEGSPQSGPTQSPPTPLFPQTFQPVQLVAQPAMMINYNGTNQPLVPVVQVQTPNGPQFQPVYYLPDQQFAGTPPLPIPGGHKFLAPEQHPVMQDSLKNKGSRSGSLSYDGRSMSFSRDGSEISDSGDGKYYSGLQAGSLRRTSSDASRDGYGSDCSASRLGSDYFGDSHCSDIEEDQKTQDADVESPDKQMFYPTQPSNKRGPPGIAAPAHVIRAVQVPQKNEAGRECNPKTQTYTSTFLMQYQSSGDCLQCPRELTPDHPTLLEHLNKEQCNNLHRYIDRLGHTKGYQVYHPSSDRQAPKKRPTSKERQEELYKTELCNYWINGQKCRFGKRCIFAHGQHELRMPKRKIERNRLRPPFRKQVVSILNKLSESNFDTLSTELLCSAVEDVRSDEHMSMTLVKAVFNKALNDVESQKMYAEIWRKLLNVHPMSQKMASQMMSICLLEYSKPRHKNAGVGTMKWISQICKKKILKSEDIVHKILSDMFIDNQREEKVELWCKLIEALKSTVNTEKYFPQLKKLKTKFSARIRFMIMDLEDLKQRNWVPRQ